MYLWRRRLANSDGMAALLSVSEAKETVHRLADGGWIAVFHAIGRFAHAWMDGFRHVAVGRGSRR